jgi:hypothetical protein
MVFGPHKNGGKRHPERSGGKQKMEILNSSFVGNVNVAYG